MNKPADTLCPCGKCVAGRGCVPMHAEWFLRCPVCFKRACGGAYDHDKAECKKQ